MQTGSDGYFGGVIDQLREPLDAVLHLLDRQVVDDDGMLVCNVDDVELEESPTHELVVSGLLVGPAALLPRFAGNPGNVLLGLWHKLGIERAHRTTPWRIPIELVEDITSRISLSVPREGVLHVQDEDRPTRRLNELLGCEVLCEEGELGKVLDARLKPVHGRLVCDALIVGRGRPGSMLGYDRRRMGPAVLGHMMRWLHRHTGQIGMDQVRSLDWEQRALWCAGGLEPLS